MESCVSIDPVQRWRRADGGAVCGMLVTRRLPNQPAHGGGGKDGFTQLTGARMDMVRPQEGSLIEGR